MKVDSSVSRGLLKEYSSVLGLNKLTKGHIRIRSFLMCPKKQRLCLLRREKEHE
jgi:hypothetical protein